MQGITKERGPLGAARAAIEAGDLRQAGMLAAAAWCDLADDGPAQAEAGFLLCMTHNRRGEWAALLQVAPAVQALLERHGDGARLVEFLRWVTLAACELARFDVGLAAADASCRHAEAGGDRAQLALSLTAMGCCIERMGDPWQSHRLMEEARALVQGLDEPYTRCIILNNLCAAYLGAYFLLRDTARREEIRTVVEAAVACAREAVPIVRRMPFNDFMTGVIEGNLGEALVHLGALDEAGPLLDAALRRVAEQGNAARGWRIRYARAERMLAGGEARAASGELEALCEELAGSQQTNTLTRVHEAAYRAWRTLGDVERALRHLERFGDLERRRVVVQLQAQSRLFVTRVEAERVRLEAQAERLRAAEFEADAQRDELTGLGNRRAMDRRMGQLASVAADAGAPMCVALVDLDHFKRVNDRYGHAVGDRVLAHIGQLLRDNSRADDLLVRLGGEEFLVVLPGTTLAEAREACERLRARVQAFDWGRVAAGLAVTLSVGLAAAPSYDPRRLLDAADAAMYHAKAEGRDRVCG